MNNIGLLYTLGSGTILAFLLFFGFYLGLKWEGKKAAFITIVIMWLLYFPLAFLFWPGIDIFAIHFVFFTMTGYGLGIVTNVRSTRMRMEGDSTSDGWFHWGPAIIVGFFLMLTVVDSNIISIAGKYKPGIVAHDFREKEGQYNSYQKQMAAQQARGWKVTGGWDGQPSLNESKPFVIEAVDKAGNPIVEADVQANFLSTANTDKDLHIKLSETERGVYAADVALPIYGQWTILVVATKGDDVHEIKGQIEVTPDQKK